MEILAEIHFGIPAGIALILVLVYLNWNHNQLYPLYLERQIRKGKSWLYLPLNWNPKRKAFTRLVSKILFSLSAFSILIASLFIDLDMVIAVLIGSGISFLIWVLGSIILKKRFQQQVNAYFGFVDAIVAEFEREGKRFSEQELNNLAAYQFQNALRSADSNSRLLKELDERS